MKHSRLCVHLKFFQSSLQQIPLCRNLLGIKNFTQLLDWNNFCRMSKKTSSGNVTLPNHIFVLVCGGHITSTGQTIETPNYPSNYPVGTTCTWQIHVPATKLLVKFERFVTYDVHDKLEAWNSITTLSCKS